MKRVNRVAITGIGVVNSQQIGMVEEAGNISEMPGYVEDKNRFMDKGYQIAYSKISDIDFGKYIPGISTRCVDKISIYTGIATSMATSGKSFDVPGVGMAVGTALGSIVSITDFDIKALTEGPNAVNPMEFPNTVSNAPGSRTGIWFNLKGPSITVSNGFTSSMDAVGYAFDEIAYANETYFLAGGSEELSENSYHGYARVALESFNGQAGSHEKEILGEGSGLLLLCSMEEAVNKGYEIHGEISDYYSSKINVNSNFAAEVKDIIAGMLDSNELEEKDVLIYTGYLPYNGLSGRVHNELSKHFGAEKIISPNKLENASMNYLGLNGVFNITHAVKEIKEKNDNVKGAVVFDIGCDGKFSGVVVKY